MAEPKPSSATLPVDPKPPPPAEPVRTPPAAPPASPPTPPAALRPLLTADAFISHLQRAATPRAGSDVILLFLSYAARLSGSVLESLGRNALRRSIRDLLTLATKLPPSTTVVLDSAPAPPAAALALQLAARLKAVAGMLGEWRMMGRLWGLLGLYSSLRKLLVKSMSEKDEKDPEAKFDTALAYAQVFALISYQAAENVALLSSKKILGYAPATQAKLARWSVRSWALYIGMELGRLLIERSRAKQGVEKKDAAWHEDWFKNFSRNLAWAPLTVHWSIDNGPLSELMICLLAYYPASGYMRDLWRSTA